MERLMLTDTKLPTIQIKKSEKGCEYEYIYSGSEGSVYKYDETTAMKFFLGFDCDLNEQLKYEKIELLGELEDEQAAFPIGLVGYESGFKEGFYMKRVQPFDEEEPSILVARNRFSLKENRDILISGSLALQRLHIKGFIHGDIKPGNVLIDSQKRPIFIDIDNGLYADYDYDLPSYIAGSFHKTYHKELSPLDNDKYMYALLAMKIILKDVNFSSHMPSEFYKAIIKRLNVSESVKKELLYIFSSKKDKPYIGPVLEEIDPEEKILTL